MERLDYVIFQRYRQVLLKEVADVLQLDQEVSVKVLSINEDGKISLSIKQASPESNDANGKPSRPNNDFKKKSFDQRKPYDQKKDFSKKKEFSRPPRDFAGARDSKPKEENFEDMLTGYMKNSSEKLKNVKKARSRKGNGFNR